MKSQLILLVVVLLAATALHGADGHSLRYQEPAARSTLTLSHAIEVLRDPPIEATRDLSMELSLAAGESTGSVDVTIGEAGATSMAHGMKQRLGTRHLTGKSFELSTGEEGLTLEPVQPDAPALDLGHPVGAYSIPALFTSALPVLPRDPVAFGDTWTTEYPLRSLEGWSWGTGLLTSRHQVTSVRQQGGSTVLSIRTEGKARLTPSKGEDGYTGDLKRTMRWSFDATRGRLLSMSIQQETTGETPIPQGVVRIRQVTRIDLTPVS